MNDIKVRLRKHREQWSGSQKHGLNFGSMNALVEALASELERLEAELAARKKAEDLTGIVNALGRDNAAYQADEENRLRAENTSLLAELAEWARPCDDVEDVIYHKTQVCVEALARRLAARLRTSEDKLKMTDASLQEMLALAFNRGEQLAAWKMPVPELEAELTKVPIQNHYARWLRRLAAQLRAETEARNALEGERTELQAKIGRLEQQLAVVTEELPDDLIV